MANLLVKNLKSALPIAIVALLLAAPVAVSAVTTTQNTTVNAQVAAVISMTTSTTVNLAITPTSAGAMTSASDTVSVTTNNSTGYALSLADADATTSLVNGANTIAAHTGTQATPTALATNSWGYRVDGVGGFGAGPTSAESNVANTAFTWAGVPASGSPNTLKTTSTTASSDPTTVWYGAKVSTAKPAGTYTDVVTYTAVTNP
ncbi:MAG: hypothetical protein EOT04_02775 [Candidatus Chaera renei]|uniref:Uncharacterized protein n=1 Tax=Candidatus Chaera renei TaxID=2506947 RepID=A0A4V1J7B7_9BACT|nr:MAG: hypothetical protein EOT04_02775 [Candidatus Chaera renei]